MTRKQKYKIYQKEWRFNNKDYCKSYNKQYKLENKERYKKLLTDWKNKNPDRVKYLRDKFRRIHAKEIKIEAAEYYKKYPYLRRFSSMKTRCNNTKSKDYKWYGEKGIKCLLTKEQLAHIWYRDNASGMKQPSIDRINSNGNYELNNCRFIEMTENSRRSALERCAKKN